jgi:hypothetical protein
MAPAKPRGYAAGAAQRGVATASRQLGILLSLRG